MVYEQGVLNGARSVWTVSLLQAGAGNIGAALETERAIQATKPSHVLFVGVGGGIKDADLGDVVAADRVYHYESGKEEEEFKARPHGFTTSYRMLYRARALATSGDWTQRIHLPDGAASLAPTAYVGAIAAGEKVVASTKAETFRRIRTLYNDALAVEMEGYGFLHALHAHQELYGLVIRGISDHIDQKSRSDAAGWQEIASAAAAAFAVSVLLDLNVEVEPQERAVERDVWDEVRRLVCELYPAGPDQNQLWDRAGGSLATLNLRQNGSSAWYAALRLLRQGGGGPSITLASLVNEIASDFPNNATVRRLRERLGAG